MGRYEAERTSLSHRLAGGIDQALAKTPFTRPKLPRLKRHATRPMWGFIFSVGFLLVSIVDPYSGTMASASTMQVYDYEGGSPEQTYGYASTQKISYSRGGFNIVTGDDACFLKEAPHLHAIASRQRHIVSPPRIGGDLVLTGTGRAADLGLQLQHDDFLHTEFP